MTYARFIQKRHIISGVSVIAALILVMLLFSTILNRGERGDSSTQEPAQRQRSEAKRVFIKDFHQLEDNISSSRVEYELYARVSNAGSAPDLYTGTIRDGSYTKQSLNGVIIAKFLVDIIPTDTAYLVTITTLRGNSSITIACAEKEQQINKSAKCEDPEYI